MSKGVIMSRYARALLKFSEKNGDGAATCDQARRLEETLDSSPQLVQAITDPVAVGLEKKMELLRSALSPEEMTVSMEAFARLVLRNGRADVLRLILHSFRLQYLASRNIHLATLITAVEPPEGLPERIRSIVCSQMGGELRIISKVDPDIIGGMVLYVDDTLFDGSVKGQLDKLRHGFEEKNKRIL